ncbi:MAG: adenylosuccinate synthetase [Candidatus Saccharibacteria bacterium]|nr:adenylosuccinate synthetase [Candidatus Saccharibacteria bacterium]
MIEKIYRVTDLGPGDGGKGGVVQALVEKVKASVVIKEGGAQGSHGICTPKGSFAFSQWGCGTFNHAPTHLSENFVISPIGLINESKALGKCAPLRGELNPRPFALITASPSCVCATPYHLAWSQIYEILLKDQPHGTIGTGVGKAYRDSLENPERTIFAKDLKNEKTLRSKLSASRNFLLEKYGSLIAKDVLPEDVEALSRNKEILTKADIFEDIVGKFLYISKQLTLKETSKILQEFSGNAIIERSHGVLTDNETGLKPHVSNLRTLPSVSDEMLKRAGYSGKVVNLAVHRAYEIRHGAGPIPTANDELRETLLPGSHKMTNRWQGDVRVGPLDIRLMRYALKACGGAEKFNGLCLTWFDQIIKNGEWQICVNYILNGELLPEDTELTTEILNRVEPVIVSYEVPSNFTRTELANWCGEILSMYIDLPVRLVSFGPQSGDKIYL